MSWYRTIYEVIDLRSFSNVWYWIVVAAIWTGVGHWTFGAPYDLLQRARKDAAARNDLEGLVRLTLRRRTALGGAAGPWLIGAASAGLTAAALLGFRYDVEFAQAVLLIAAPLFGLWLLDERTAHAIIRDRASGQELWGRLARVRRRRQLVGFAAVFVTAVWGMLRNLSVGALGG